MTSNQKPAKCVTITNNNRKKEQHSGKSPFATTWEGRMIYEALQNTPIEMKPGENICDLLLNITTVKLNVLCRI